jgi:hypothetical protein
MIMPPQKRKPKPKSDDYDEPPSESPEDEGSIRVHDAYLEHRLGGGEPATPEAFRRAVEQFEQLPGAVRTGPASARSGSSTREQPSDDEPDDPDQATEPAGPQGRS